MANRTDRPLPAETPFIVAAWDRFKATDERTDFELLFRHYAPLAKYHAHHVYPRDGHPACERRDLASAGHVALTGAIRAFDPHGEGTFVAFSWKILRRAMLDELRRYSWRNKSAPLLNKIVSKHRERFAQQHGFQPVPEW